MHNSSCLPGNPLAKIARFLWTCHLKSAEEAVAKSTYPDNEIPKAKHVMKLIRIINLEVGSSKLVQNNKNED